MTYQTLLDNKTAGWCSVAIFNLRIIKKPWPISIHPRQGERTNMTNEDLFTTSRRSVLKNGVMITGLSVVGSVAMTGTAAAGIGAGRVGHYTLNNLQGKGKNKTEVHDSSPENNHGTNHGAEVVKGGGNVGNAFEFDGIDDHVKIPDDSSLDITDALTVAAWVKAPTQEDFARVISRERSGVGKRQYNLGFDASGTKPRTIVDTTGANGEEVVGPGVADDSWHHLATTFDADGELLLYVDGDEVDATAVDSPLVSVDVSVTLGAPSHVPEKDWYAGRLDEARIYDRVLSADEIEILASMGGNSGNGGGNGQGGPP